MSGDVDSEAGSGSPTTFLVDGVGECDFQLAIPALDHALAIARRLCLLPASIRTCIAGLQESAGWKVEGNVAPVSEGLEHEITDWFEDENRVRVVLDEAPSDGYPRPRLPSRVYLSSRLVAAAHRAHQEETDFPARYRRHLLHLSVLIAVQLQGLLHIHMTGDESQAGLGGRGLNWEERVMGGRMIAVFGTPIPEEDDIEFTAQVTDISIETPHGRFTLKDPVIQHVIDAALGSPGWEERLPFQPPEDIVLEAYPDQGLRNLAPPCRRETFGAERCGGRDGNTIVSNWRPPW